MSSLTETFKAVRRRASTGLASDDKRRQNNFSRQSTQTLIQRGDEEPLSDEVTRGNTAYRTPDDTRGAYIIDTVNGDRLQDFANSHLSEGPAPGRIPRFWNDRRSGRVGRSNNNPVGDNFLTLEITGIASGGAGDGKFLAHQKVPRGTALARAAARTVDDSAQIPAVYVSDPTRR